jgi:hypothetical protein
VTPPSLREVFGLGLEDVAISCDEPEDRCGTQAPCLDCKEWVLPEQGCYAPVDLPDDWRKVEPFASQACATEGCTCWGGSDRECEDCWLSLK